jgi:hypothetical protein
LGNVGSIEFTALVASASDNETGFEIRPGCRIRKLQLRRDDTIVADFDEGCLVYPVDREASDCVVFIASKLAEHVTEPARITQ